MKKQFLLCLCALSLCAACNKSDTPGACSYGGPCEPTDEMNEMINRKPAKAERTVAPAHISNRMTDTLRNAPGSPQPLIPLPPDNGIH